MSTTRTGWLTSGAVPPIRWLAPVATLGYITLMTKGQITGGDWLFAALCGAISMAGGRFPVAVALGQSALLVTFQIARDAGPNPVKDAGKELLSSGFVNDSTAAPIYLMASLALVELAARRPLRISVLAGVVLAAVQLGIIRTNGTAPNLLTIGYHLTVAVVAPLLLGAYLQATMRTYQQAKEAAAAADQRRREAEQTARLTERTDVAREIHDLVAHHVASIALRTAVAQDLMPNLDPTDIATVLDDVHTAATTALADLRKLVTVLRDPNAVGPAMPAQFGPGLLDPDDLPQALHDTLDRARSSGLTVTAHIDPGVAVLDAVRALAVLRTVQEGLTNVTKHAGSGATVDVLVSVLEGQVEVSITDTGPDRAPLSELAVRDSLGPGHGLVGLAERLNLLGGHLTAGPSDAGWRLGATLPSAAEPDRRPAERLAEPSP